MAFLDLEDRSGRMQLQSKVDVLGPEQHERLLSLDLGDLVGVDGRVFKSRKGELTVQVEDFTVLAKSLRPPPDKHHGVQDVELRFRRRELDLIGNAESRDALHRPREDHQRRAPLPRRARASSRSRPRCCSRSTAARSRGRSSRTTTSSTATSTCGSRPSSTSSG